MRAKEIGTTLANVRSPAKYVHSRRRGNDCFDESFENLLELRVAAR